MPLRRTPLKRGTKGLRQVSPKREQRLREWARIKRRKIRTQREARGYTWCEVCDKPTQYLELDHVVPAGNGGTWTADNAQLICAGDGSCHDVKHGRPWP